MADGKAGRPQKPIDWDLVDELIEGGCAASQIAPHFHMHPNTFTDRVFQQYDMVFTEYAYFIREKGLSNLKMTQYKKALAGDTTLLIWLGKQYLGQRDRTEITGNSTDPLTIVLSAVSGLSKDLVNEQTNS